MKISLIVPCYNEEEALPIFYRETKNVLETMPCEHEFVFINDGSRDRTLAVLKELAGQDGCVQYLSFSRNFGKEAAMYAGFCNVTGDYVAVMDADMQDPPALLPEMLDKLLTGEYDSVATCRVTRKGEPPIRSWFARLFYRMINRVSDADIVDGARDFRLMRREMVDAIVEMGEYNRFSKGLFGWVGYKTKWLEYENIERKKGETKWSFFKLLAYSIDGIVAFSTAPVRFAAWLGIAFCMLAFLFILVIIGRTLVFGDPVAGWPSLVCIILMLSGIQLFCLGLMGEYLSKTYLEVKKRPIYLCKETNVEKDEK